MQSDFAAQLKNPSRSQELLLRKCVKLFLLASEWVELFCKAYLVEQFPRFSEGPVAGNPREHVFFPDWVKYDFPDRIEEIFFFAIRWSIVIVFDTVGSKKC